MSAHVRIAGGKSNARIHTRHGRFNTAPPPVHDQRAENVFLAGLPILAVGLCVLAFVIIPLVRLAIR